MAAFMRQQNGVVTDRTTRKAQIFPILPFTGSLLTRCQRWVSEWSRYCSPLSLLTSSFIDLYQCNLQVSLLCCGYNPTLPVFILLLQVFQIWPLGAPLGGFLCFEQCLPSFLSTLYFLTTEDVPASCFFSCLTPVISPFSKEPWFLLLEKSQTLGAKQVHCCWGITASRASQQTELENSCMYTNAHRHTHLYLFLCLSTYLLKSHVFILMVGCNLPPCLICNFFLGQAEIWLMLPTMYLWVPIC